MKILFVGETWFGSCARACSAALRRLGCDVLEFDTRSFFPQWNARDLRIVRRLLKGRIIADFNARLLEAAISWRPEVLLAFKGSLILSSTLKKLRDRGVRLYNYYPDRMIFVRGSELETALPQYDCVFDTKRSWDGDIEQHLRLRGRVFVPHGYDPEIHLPARLSHQDCELFSCDVSFIGTYTRRKERFLKEVARLCPALSMRIFGNDWNRCHAPGVQKFIHGCAVNGQSYAKAIAASRINLALMGVSDEALDETTTRTYEIPACKGFMLHERTDEVLTLYEEDREIACFGSVEELLEKIKYYLNNPSECARLAEQAYHRAVPQYSYDNRMRQILEYHYAS